MQLDPIAIEAGVGLVALGMIGSTNAEAGSRARGGERGPLWITAEAQTAGRGRLGRSWNSPPGNLYASLLLSDPSPFEHAPELAFVAALALRDAIVAEAPALGAAAFFQMAERPVAGRREMRRHSDRGRDRRWQHPDRRDRHRRELRAPSAGGVRASARHEAGSRRMPPRSASKAVLFPATDLRAHGADVTPQRLFMRLSAAMCGRIAQWDRGEGFTAILGGWLSAAQGLGEPIRVRDGNGEKIGRFVGLDRSGRLVLELSGGTLEKISAGDVFPFAAAAGWKMPGPARLINGWSGRRACVRAAWRHRRDRDESLDLWLWRGPAARNG